MFLVASGGVGDVNGAVNNNVDSVLMKVKSLGIFWDAGEVFNGANDNVSHKD